MDKIRYINLFDYFCMIQERNYLLITLIYNLLYIIFMVTCYLYEIIWDYKQDLPKDGHQLIIFFQIFQGLCMIAFTIIGLCYTKGDIKRGGLFVVSVINMLYSLSNFILISLVEIISVSMLMPARSHISDKTILNQPKVLIQVKLLFPIIMLASLVAVYFARGIVVVYDRIVRLKERLRDIKFQEEYNKQKLKLEMEERKLLSPPKDKGDVTMTIEMDYLVSSENESINPPSNFYLKRDNSDIKDSFNISNPKNLGHIRSNLRSCCTNETRDS